MSELFSGALPTANDAELAMLAGVLLNPFAMDDVAPLVSPEDFCSADNRAVYEAALEIHNQGKRIDQTLIVSALKKGKKFDDMGHGAGGYAHLAGIATASMTTANVVHYAREIADAATKRRIVFSAKEMAVRAYDLSVPAEEALSFAESSVFSLRDDRGGDVVALSDLMLEVTQLIDKRTTGQVSSGIKTGLATIDEKFKLRNNEVTIVAARPGMGKTAFALNVARNVAHSTGQVFFASLEMGRLELSERLLSIQSQVPSYKIRDGYINRDEATQVMEAASALKQMPIVLDDTARQSVLHIASIARRLKRQKGLALVVIDYLQLIEAEQVRGVPREQQVSQITRRLKQLAKELCTPLLVLCQLNRQTETLVNHRPRLHHLRESGAIEQDADNVMFLHREDYYQPGKNKGEAVAHIDKQRNGPVFDAPLCWWDDRQTFAARRAEQTEQDEWHRQRERPPWEYEQ